MSLNKKKCDFCRVFSWLVVAVWMAVIFLFSAQIGEKSGDTSGSIVRWVVNLFYRNFEALPEVRRTEILELWHVIIRKGAHFTEYAVLGALICNALRTCSVSRSMKWILPVAVSAVYAVTDEIHQYFVPDRACRFLDICIDTSGAIFGTAIFTLLVFLISKGKRKNIG